MVDKRFRVKSKVPVSVAKPSLKRVRGHEDGLAAMQMGAKKYKLSRTEKKKENKGRGAAVPVKAQPHPTAPVECAAMAKLRKMWLEKTLPRVDMDPPTEKQPLYEKTKQLWDLLEQAVGRAPVVTGKKARYSRMGVKGLKWEVFIWGQAKTDCIGLGYGTFTVALYIALDSAVAMLMHRVKERDGEQAGVAAQEEEEEEEQQEEEEGEEMEEGEEGEEVEEDEE